MSSRSLGIPDKPAKPAKSRSPKDGPPKGDPPGLYLRRDHDTDSLQREAIRIHEEEKAREEAGFLAAETAFQHLPLFLPGTRIDFRTGYRRYWFKGGTFSITPSGTVYYSDDDSALVSEVNKLFSITLREHGADRAQQTLNPHHRNNLIGGAYNVYRRLQFTENRRFREAVRNGFVARGDVVGEKAQSLEFGDELKLFDIGARMSSEDVDPLSAWKEAWMVLQSACIGLHPRVFGCSWVSHVVSTSPWRLTQRSFYLMRHCMVLSSFAYNTRHDADEKTPRLLYQAFQFAGKFGLLMADIKPANIVVEMVDETGPVGASHLTRNAVKVQFIDLDEVYTLTENADPDCIFFINAVMLLNNIACQTTRPSMLAKYANLTTPLLETVAKLLKRFTDSDDTTELCNVFVNAVGTAARKPRESTPILESKDYAALTSYILGMARHYTAWFQKQPVGKRECYDPRFRADEPAVPQMITIARQMLGIPIPSEDEYRRGMERYIR